MYRSQRASLPAAAAGREMRAGSLTPAREVAGREAAVLPATGTRGHLPAQDPAAASTPAPAAPPGTTNTQGPLQVRHAEAAHPCSPGRELSAAPPGT
ncbi:hypothetical protein GALLR39Z86_05940 [Glycomyces algeriensis]|uniref:Uncharacterized protein n=1 Tax=Glycomyces algeriensis TaxID=256037 RepID=A0A9W6G497_9ACTN|nr:hypothetical protein GALLR39Z86_05940 [Glycomyces algeriensis]